jgi:hypothetical protein
VELGANRVSVALDKFRASSHTSYISSDGRLATTATERSEAVDCSPDLDLDLLPNDLTRMLYLSSLRDCNSGRYLHPEFSARLGIEAADRALSACHDGVFRRLLAVPMSGYVDQLEQYICYARMEKTAVLKTWQSLQAYRATVPVLASSLYVELFCLNIEGAVTILSSRSLKENTRR